MINSEFPHCAKRQSNGPVGNSTKLTNADGLGGSFSYNYSYDDLYRLWRWRVAVSPPIALI